MKTIRPLAAPTQINISGRHVGFIDGWHAKLFEYGRHLHDRGISKRMRDPLWSHFAGMVESQPEYGLPFGQPHHVDFWALALYDDVSRGSWEDAATIIDPDRQAQYFKRNIRALCTEFLGD